MNNYESSKPKKEEIAYARQMVLRAIEMGILTDDYDHRAICNALNCSIPSGAERSTIIFKDGPLANKWVVKLTYAVEDHSPSEIEDYSDDKVFSRRPEVFNDSSAREAYFYKKACERQLDYAFAPSFYFHAHGYGFEMQRFVEIDEDAIQKYFFDFASNYFEDDDEDEEYEYGRTGRIWSYVEDEMDNDECLSALFGYDGDLVRFCDEYSIGDLHSLNCGFKPNSGEIILIDFAGYHN